MPLKAERNHAAILLHLLSCQEARKATSEKYCKILWKHYKIANCNYTGKHNQIDLHIGNYGIHCLSSLNNRSLHSQKCTMLT